MDDFTRQIVADAIAQDDFVRRDFECWQFKRQRQQREQQELEQRQAAYAAEQRAVRAWLSDEVRTTDFYKERNEAGNTGNENDDAWNEWARQIAETEATKASNQLIDDLDRFHDRMQAQIAELKAKIADLEVRLAGLGDLRREANGSNASERWN
jgi:hypothetical protein